jgi:hypothetical protein
VQSSHHLRSRGREGPTDRSPRGRACRRTPAPATGPINLTDNAIKYSPRLRHRDRGPKGARQDRGWWRSRTRGRGIPGPSLAVFERLPDRRGQSRDEGGAGLGLSIAPGSSNATVDRYTFEARMGKEALSHRPFRKPANARPGGRGEQVVRSRRRRQGVDAGARPSCPGREAQTSWRPCRSTTASGSALEPRVSRGCANAKRDRAPWSRAGQRRAPSQRGWAEPSPTTALVKCDNLPRTWPSTGCVNTSPCDRDSVDSGRPRRPRASGAGAAARASLGIAERTQAPGRRRYFALWLVTLPALPARPGRSEAFEARTKNASLTKEGRAGRRREGGRRRLKRRHRSRPRRRVAGHELLAF